MTLQRAASSHFSTMLSIAAWIMAITFAFTSGGIASLDAGPKSAISWWIGMLSPRERSGSPDEISKEKVHPQAQ